MVDLGRTDNEYLWLGAFKERSYYTERGEGGERALLEKILLPPGMVTFRHNNRSSGSSLATVRKVEA